MMEWDKEQKEFENPLQYFLWRQTMNLIPLDISISNIQEDDLQHGCIDLYHYIFDAFQDVYKHPQLYAVNPIEKVDGKSSDRIYFQRFFLYLILELSIDLNDKMYYIHYEKLKRLASAI